MELLTAPMEILTNIVVEDEFTSSTEHEEKDETKQRS
jgi:hypothetical protein